MEKYKTNHLLLPLEYILKIEKKTEYLFTRTHARLIIRVRLEYWIPHVSTCISIYT